MANIKSRVERLEEAEGIGRDKLFVILKRFAQPQHSALRVNDTIFNRQPKESNAALEKRVIEKLKNRPGALFVLVPTT
jgi:hypothetical protein